MNEVKANRLNLAALWSVYLVIFVGFVGYSLMITVLTPLFLHANSQAFPGYVGTSHSAVWLGIVLCAYPAAQFFGSPVIGALSDRFGRKQPLFWSLLVLCFLYLAIGLSIAMNSYPALLIFTFVCGLFEGNIVIAQSIIADISDASNRTRLFGYIYLSSSLAFVLGPLVGGQLAYYMGVPVSFYAVVVLLVAMLFVVKRNLVETHAVQMRSDKTVGQALRQLCHLFSPPAALPWLWRNFILYVAIFGFFRCYPMYLVSHFHMHVGKESLFIAYVAVPIVLANAGLTGRLDKRYSAWMMVRGAAIFLGACLIGIVALGFAEWTLFFTLFLTGLCVALALPACSAHLSLMICGKQQGAVMGNNQALQVAAEAISGLVGGYLATVSHGLPLVFLGILAWVAAITFFYAPAKQSVG